MDFMESPEARPVRILSEFLEPQVRFEKLNVSDTIVFFGSARLLPESEARGKALEMSRYYEDARELARLMTIWSKELKNKKRRFIVCSGGGPGIMQAANQGAHDADGLSIGFNISIPFEQNSNPYITDQLNFEFHYFFIRKYWFAYMAKALIIFPGGFGTLDELFEILTLIQTKKMTKRIPIVIYGSSYWKSVLHFDEMVKHGTISKEDLNLLKFCDSPKEAYDYLTDELTKLYIE